MKLYGKFVNWVNKKMKKCAVKRENYDLLKTYLLAREDFLGKTAIISIDFPSTYCESADNGLSDCYEQEVNKFFLEVHKFSLEVNKFSSEVNKFSLKVIEICGKKRKLKLGIG